MARVTAGCDVCSFSAAADSVPQSAKATSWASTDISIMLHLRILTYTFHYAHGR